MITDRARAGCQGLRIGLSPDYDAVYYPDFETGELRSHQKKFIAYRSAELLAKAGAEIVENVPSQYRIRYSGLL